jgi:hypothetical protein
MNSALYRVHSQANQLILIEQQHALQMVAKSRVSEKRLYTFRVTLLLFANRCCGVVICTHCSTKASGLIFRTSRSGSHVPYSCHHNSSRFTFPILVHSWHFFHSLQSITPRVYEPKTPTHSLNLKLKHELKFINFPRCVAC